VSLSLLFGLEQDVHALQTEARDTPRIAPLSGAR
jgi:hypothetical protein